jgi:hypothetical protein
MKLEVIMACAFAAVVLLAGCATTSTRDLYSGPERPSEELASVIVPWQVQIRNVNGERLPMSLFSGSEKASTFRILPGAQEWSVRYYDPFADDRQNRDPYAVVQSAIVSLRFAAEAGHVYRLKVETPEQNASLRDAKDPVRFSVVGEDGTEAAPVERRPPCPVDAGRTSTSALPPATFEQATLDQLKNWWRVAAPAERKAFLEWVDDEHQP